MNASIGAPRAMVELLDRARARVSVDTLFSRVAWDPGAGGYFDMFAPILREGLPAIEKADCRSFDFTETVGLNRWGTPRDREGRWFRILTCAAELIARALDRGTDEPPLAYSILPLLVDSLALHKDGDRQASLDLLDDVCVETLGIKQNWMERGDHCFVALARLLLSKDRPASEQETLGRELQAKFDRTQVERFEDGDVNPLFEPSEEYIWGLTCFDQLHFVWLRLIEDNFPRTSPLLEEIYVYLVVGGARWASAEPRLS